MRKSTPESRNAARDNAEVIGQAERVIRAEVRDWVSRVANHWATPTVAVTAFVGYIFFAHVLVGQINL
jgi:hypothetical protein